MNETNWVSQSASPTVTESDRMGLEKAHQFIIGDTKKVDENDLNKSDSIKVMY